MKKVILSLLVVVGFALGSIAAKRENNTQQVERCSYHTVTINLVYWDNGEPISGESVQGPMYAFNLETSEYFYSEDYFATQVFEDLPAGTYRFGGMDGYFCGYSSVEKNINGDEEFQVKIWCE